MSKRIIWLCCVLLAVMLVGCNQSEQSSAKDQSPNVGFAVADIPFKQRRVAIVYSDTSAKRYFDEFAFGQLYTAMQHQAMQAGIPYDLLNEADLIDTTSLAQYDALIIPVMSHVDRSIRSQIISSLLAAQENGLAIVTSSEFMTYDQDGQVFDNAYSAMIDLLGLTPKAYQVGVPAELNVVRNDHPITARYKTNELIDDYAETWFAEFSPVDASQAITLVDAKVGNQKHAAIQVLERAGRVVHFANDEFLADNNILWSAIRWAIYADKAPVSLLPSRSPSLFIARNDMDQAMVAPALVDNEIPLLDIIKDWKRDYNFVGSYYIDIGNAPSQGLYTDWGVSAPLYAEYLALGSEFGTHSWTHPHYTSELSDVELEFEFNQSRQEISDNLGINVIGGAVPGNPEDLRVVENLNQWFDYFSGRSITGATGYRSGYGRLQPAHQMRYFNLNMTPDFGLIDFLNYTPTQARRIWIDEFDALEVNAEMPVMHWLWHDYGPTAEAKTGRYSKRMFESTINYAFKAGSEFATLADYNSRLNAFEAASFSTGVNGNITARIDGTGLGQFALKMDEGQEIASVENWYAYSGDAVFIPDDGGEFSIVPGTRQDKVTRIVELPMRARLLRVNGNANELFFSFTGQGNVTVELSDVMKDNVSVLGADSMRATGNELVLNFVEIGNHTVSITAINPVNSPPVSIAETVTTQYSIPVNVVLNADDRNQDALSYTVINQPSKGKLSGIAPNLQYVPNDGFSGVDSFTFTSNDGALSSVVATFTIIVGSPAVANSVPVANKAVYNTVTGQNLNVLLSGADNEGQNLQFTIVDQPTNGTLSGSVPNLVYTPENGFIGKDEFTYRVSDGELQSTIERVVFNISAQAVASNGTVSNLSTTGIVIDGLLNDWVNYVPFSIDSESVLAPSDYDWKQAWMAHDANSFFIAFEQYQQSSLDWRNQVYIDSDTQRTTGFTGFANEYPLGADFMIEGNSLLSYTGSGTDWSWSIKGTIDAEAAGNHVEVAVPRAQLGNAVNMNMMFASINLDSAIDYYPDDATNGDAAQYTRRFSYSVNANINPANAAPVANSIVHNTTHNAELPIVLGGYDIDNDTLSYAVTSQPARGTLTGTPPMMRYMPNAGYIGTDSFSFTVNDGTLLSNTATVQLNIVAPPALDSIPVAHNKSVVVPVDASVSITLTGSDYDGSSLAFNLAEKPTNGSLSGAAPQLVYKPLDGYAGVDSFSYVVNDGVSNSELATVSIVVGSGSGSTNTAPVAGNQSLVTEFETAIGVTLTGSDAEADALTYTINKQPAAGTLSGAAPNLTYTPDRSATGIDSFAFVVSDGLAESSVATVSINIKAQVLSNQAPNGIGQTLNTALNNPISILLSGTDPEHGALGFQISQQPIGGTISGNAPNIVYTPNANFTGVDRLHFVVDDGTLISDAAIVTINVAGNPNELLSNTVSSMNIDGDIADWVGLSPFDNDPDDVSGLNNPLNWLSMMMAHDTNNFYFMFRNDGPFTLSWGHAMHIDVDGDVNTGFRDFDNSAPIGADFLIEGNNIHAYTGTGGNWSWTYVGTATSALKNDVLEFAIPRTQLGEPTNLQFYLRASNEPFGGDIIDHYPDKALDASAAFVERVLRYTVAP